MALATLELTRTMPCAGYDKCLGCISMFHDKTTFIQICSQTSLWHFLDSYLLPLTRQPTWPLVAIWNDTEIYVRGRSINPFNRQVDLGTIKIYKMGDCPDIGNHFEFDLQRLLQTQLEVTRNQRQGFHNMKGCALQDALMNKVLHRFWEVMPLASTPDVIKKMGNLFCDKQERYREALLMALAVDAGRDWLGGYTLTKDRPIMQCPDATHGLEHAGRVTPGMASAACKALYRQRLDPEKSCHDVIELCEAHKSDANKERMTKNIAKVRNQLEDFLHAVVKDHFEEDPDNECVVCLVAKPTVMMVKCGHVCVCADCRVKMLVKEFGQVSKRKYDSKELACPLCRAVGTTKRMS